MSEFEFITLTRKITEDNVPKDCCVNRLYGKKATHSVSARYKGFPLHLIFCEHHAKEIDELSLRDTKKVT